MDELTKNHEEFIKDKKINYNGIKSFNKALKKASKRLISTKGLPLIGYFILFIKEAKEPKKQFH